MSTDTVDLGSIEVAADATTGKAMSRKSFGLYVGAIGQPEFDWEKAISQIADSHFNAISVHLLSPWSNYLPFYPWNFHQGTFDLASGNMNHDWEDHLSAMLDACWRPRPLTMHPVAPEFAMGDSFFTDNLRSNWPLYGSVYHPFRDNNIHLNWGPDAVPFYNAMGKGVSLPYPPWLTWVTDKGPYAVHGAIGDALLAYYSAVADIVAAKQKQYPVRSKAAPLFVRCYNECKAHVLPDGTIDPHRQLGGYDQIGWWAQGIFRAAGATVRMVSDWFPSQDGRTLDIPQALLAQKGLHNWGFLYEIHGCDTGSEVSGYTHAGLDSRLTIFSSDGTKEDASYPVRMKGINATGVGCEDFKLADYFTPHRYRNHDIMASFNAIFPDEEADIFGA